MLAASAGEWRAVPGSAELARVEAMTALACGTCSFTGLTGMGRPLVTWCRNGLYEPRLIRRHETSSAATLRPVRA